jgi:branched-chain amino acid transport system ATP-binding protein
VNPIPKEALRIISEEHTKLWRLVTTMDQVAQDIERGAPMEQPFFDAALDYIEQFIDQSHHPKEDQFLFRILRQRSSEASDILDALETEHANMGPQLQALRASVSKAGMGALSAGSLALDVQTYTAGLKNHIRAEEKHILPLANTVFTAEDWTEVNAAFLNHSDPMFGENSKAEFRELYHRVVSLAPESVGLGGHSGGQLDAHQPSTRSDVLLRVQDLQSHYGRIQALKGISLEVRRGETVALVGANGAGKTTFLRTLSGVQPQSAGQIFFDGEDISKLRSDKRMRRGICQSPEGRQVFGPLSIEDNLRLGAYTQPKSQVAEDLEKIFAMFPILKEKRALPAGTLSGGQQQMLAIGRALMGRPRLLLLDEPSMGLAPLLVEEVFNVIKTLKSQGMTILLVEQNAFAALGIADRGYVLETGTVTLTGTGKELISNEQVRAAYLGM